MLEQMRLRVECVDGGRRAARTGEISANDLPRRLRQPDPPEQETMTFTRCACPSCIEVARRSVAVLVAAVALPLLILALALLAMVA